MPKSDTWPGAIATEPSSSNMDSAGSADSVISTNSGFSVDSLQHLSAAERECLMYLEETIDSLDVEEDSGLSNDELETSLQAATKADHLSNAVVQRGEDSERDQKLFHHHGVPPPLLLANGFANLPQTAPADIPEPKNPEVPNDSKTPPLETNTRDLETSKTHCEVQVTDSNTCSSASQAQMLNSATDGDGNLCAPSDTKLDPDQSNPQPETDLILIPPPSDFMDEPDPEPQLEVCQDPPISVEVSGKSQHIDLEELRKRASKRAPVSSDVIHQPVPEKSAADVLESPSAPDSPMVTSANFLSEAPEPRSPPAVAPKPKKLPSNIIFKSHKTAEANFSPPASDRLLSDAQKVRMEALRKLGLLKADDADLDLHPSISSPKSRNSWSALPPSLSPTVRQTPLWPSTRTSSPSISTVPVAATVPSPSMTRVPPQSTVASTPAAQATDILPVPAAFSDTVEPPSQRSSGEASHTKSIISEPTVSTNHSLAELRNSRPRPASLGSRKEFSSVKVEAPSSKESNARRSTLIPPVSPNAGDTQGVPRYHGISVVICPRAEHDEGRREALKKLGLLKD